MSTKNTSNYNSADENRSQNLYTSKKKLTARKKYLRKNIISKKLNIKNKDIIPVLWLDVYLSRYLSCIVAEFLLIL